MLLEKLVEFRKKMRNERMTVGPHQLVEKTTIESVIINWMSREGELKVDVPGCCDLGD